MPRPPRTRGLSTIPPTEPVALAAERAAYPQTQTFALHSKPGSRRTTPSKPLTGTRTGLKLPRGRYRFAVQARHHAGWGPLSRRSNPTRAR